VTQRDTYDSPRLAAATGPAQALAAAAARLGVPPAARPERAPKLAFGRAAAGARRKRQQREADGAAADCGGGFVAAARRPWGDDAALDNAGVGGHFSAGGAVA
jgi:hypothetical protein